jgi:hypothetical protein
MSFLSRPHVDGWSLVHIHMNQIEITPSPVDAENEMHMAMHALHPSVKACVDFAERMHHESCMHDP